MRRLRLPAGVPTKFIFDFRTMLWAFGWLLAIAVLSSAVDLSVETVALWAIVHGLTLLLAGAAIYLRVIQLQRKHVSKVDLWVVIRLGAYAGAVKGISTYGAALAFGLVSHDPATALLRILGAVLVGTWVLVVLAYSLKTLDELRQARAALIRKNTESRLAAESGVAGGELTESIQIIEQLRNSITSTASNADSKRIREAVDSIIRPTSRALWTIEGRRYPPLRPVSFYRVALSSLALNPVLISGVWALTSFTGLATRAGFTATAGYVAITGVIAAVLFRLIRLGWLRSAALSAATVAAVSLTATLSGWLLSTTLLPTAALTITTTIAGAIWMTFVVIGASIISGALELRRVVLRDLESTQTQALVEERAQDDASRLVHTRLATELHGRVQSNLLGIAAALESRELPGAEVIMQLDSVLADLNKLAQRKGTLVDPDVPKQNRLQVLIASWAGIVDISIESSNTDELARLMASSPEVFEIIREGVTNAHRHGLASRVVISLRLISEGEFEIAVTDNGYGPRAGQPGLGATMLDHWTHRNWSLRGNDFGGSTLTARVTDPRAAG